MTHLVERLRTRILPALLSAAGVTMLAAGLFTYTTQVAAEPAPTPTPTVAPTPVARITLPPLSSGPAATATPTADPDRVATRIRIAALEIDMPVIEGPDGYPLCDVAMYLVHPDLGQPGQGRATYLFAHAREGMFLPLLRTPEREQLGLVVEVWTSDDLHFLYSIVDVRRDQRDLIDALTADSDELWLQTSEGPKGTKGKTQVIAEPLSVDAADPADAHPKPRPVVCG